MDEEGQASFKPLKGGRFAGPAAGQTWCHQVADEPGGDPPNVSWLESEI